MSQPREHPVPCQRCRRKTMNPTAVCDDCSPHSGACDYCGAEVYRRVLVSVPAGEWNVDLQRWCVPCAVAVGQYDGSAVSA